MVSLNLIFKFQWFQIKSLEILYFRLPFKSSPRRVIFEGGQQSYTQEKVRNLIVEWQPLPANIKKSKFTFI